jgi:hypothetical protein
MIKNQPDPRLRRTTLFVNQDDGATPIARNSTFTGRLYIDKGDANYALATGTLTNKRLPLTGANFAFTADAATDKLHAVANTLEILDGPFQATTTGVLPLNMALATDYWITPFGTDDFKISTSLPNAIAGNYVDIGDAGTGVHTWNYQGGTERGVDGDFQYEFAQPETDQVANFLTVFIPGLAGTNAPARAIVALDSDAIGFDAISEAGHTYGDEIRGMAAILFGLVSGWTTDNPQWLGLDGSTVRIQGTTTLDGRPAVLIVQLTP